MTELENEPALPAMCPHVVDMCPVDVVIAPDVVILVTRCLNFYIICKMLRHMNTSISHIKYRGTELMSILIGMPKKIWNMFRAVLVLVPDLFCICL